MRFLRIDGFYSEGDKPTKPLWRGGRMWLGSGWRCVTLEWATLTRSCHVSMRYDRGEDEWVLSVACGLFALYLRLPLRWKNYPYRYESRELSLALHSGAVWWDFWMDPDSWSCTDPKWRRGSFFPLDFLFGRHKYSERDLSSERVEVPFPEHPYPAAVRLYESSWKRPRSPFIKRVLRAEITPDTPIPVPGKGENSWDCGDDATYSLTTPAKTAAEAVQALVESVESRRTRYGGRHWTPTTAA